MTGPEHYRAAEELLAEAGRDDEISAAAGTLILRAAHAHATLALAAAVAELNAGPTGLCRDAVAGSAWAGLLHGPQDAVPSTRIVAIRSRLVENVREAATS